MTDADCVAFLRWALPELGFRWPGYRKVRRQVCRRIERRVRELGLEDVAGYRAYLEGHAGEWAALDDACHITISRFFRDRRVFALIEREVIPAVAALALARGERVLRAWSAGCASGEEPYSLALIWELVSARRFPGLELTVLATDVDEAVLRRAREALYEPSSVKELPEGWREAGFVAEDRRLRLRPEIARRVTLLRHDVRTPPPDGPFDLVLCRNLAFTYFDERLQREAAARLIGALEPGAALVVGSHETLPDSVAGLEPWPAAPSVYRKPTGSRSL